MVKTMSRCVLGGCIVAALIVAAASPSGAAVSPFAESFEGGTIGGQPTAANTAYDQTIGDRGDGDGTIHAQFVSGGWRGHGVQFSNSPVTTHAFGFLGKQVGQQTSLYLRRYYKLAAYPKYRTSVLLYKYGGNGNGQLGGTHNGSLAFGGTGQSHRFALVNNNTITTTSKVTVPLNAWFRAEVHVQFSSGAGTQTVRLYLGSNINGTTPTATIRGPLTGGYTDYVEDGILTNPGTAVHYVIDEAANGASWPDPVR